MNIFKKIYNAHQRTLYKRGFGWAISAHYIDNVSIEELNEYYTEARSFGRPNPYDLGIKQAISFIGKKENGSGA